MRKRARTGNSLTPRALSRVTAAVIGCVVGTLSFPVSAQYDCPADEVVLEEDGPALLPDGPETVSAAVPKAADSKGWAGTSALYEVPPDLANCAAGVLRPETQSGFIAALNSLRARHGLAPVRHDASADRAVAEAALMMAANDALSHDPPPSWKCWTAAGAGAAGSSNLLGGVSSPYLPYEDDDGILAEWLIEGDGDEIGHRRWLLDPYLEQTALGRVVAVLPGGVRTDSAVMKVFNASADSPRSSRSYRPVPEFVAWPQGDYPRAFFSSRARFSFSVSQDPADPDVMNGVDFSEAQVSISDGEQNLPIRDQLWDNEGYGVANCLSWRVDGIVAGRTYSVKISGVRGATRQEYSYTFRISNL